MREGHSSKQFTSTAALLYLLVGALFFLIVLHSLSDPDVSIVSPFLMESFSNTPFNKKIVHFDLKGAPPKVAYFVELLPFLRSLRVDGILLEYEDMFPYSGPLAHLRKPQAYSVADISTILKVAQQNYIDVIPLVQTFGHLEFMLKHEKFAHLREDPFYPDTICPSDNESFYLISEMLRQIRNLHPESSTIHIGADEAYHIAKDTRCEKKLANDLGRSLDRLKLWHITRVARKAREVGFHEVWAWNDMFGDIEAELLQEYDIGNLLTPVVWGYARDVTQPGYFPPGMFERYAKVFDSLLFGSAFKGANGMENTFIDVERYLANQKSYVELLKLNESTLLGRVRGIILTGWQRYNHFAPLCELLPVGLPSLVFSLHYLNNTALSFAQLAAETQKTIGCAVKPVALEFVKFGDSSHSAPLEAVFKNGSFPGHEVFDVVEELRFLTIVLTDPVLPQSSRTSLQEKINALEKKIRDVFQKYYYDDTVTEFISQNIENLDSLQPQSRLPAAVDDVQGDVPLLELPVGHYGAAV